MIFPELILGFNKNQSMVTRNFYFKSSNVNLIVFRSDLKSWRSMSNMVCKKTVIVAHERLTTVNQKFFWIYFLFEI